MEKSIIKNNLDNILIDSNLASFGSRVKGKVRDIYDLGNKMAFITTDRQSAFDRSIALVPFKGQVLNQTSAFWFEQTKDIVKNHVIDVPDPNVTIGKKLQVFPVEFVVRGFLTGVTSTSIWTAYKNGDREFCGNALPEGMVKNQPFDPPLLTPTTKDVNRDEKITAKEIVSQERMTQREWDMVSEIALALFKRGQDISVRQNLILVDTKYEFGKDENGEIFLCDEIHTPDSSRYWLRDSYETNFKNGKEPEYIDKEFLRLWFKENCDPYKDKTLPSVPEDLIIELSSRYIKLYEMITGRAFEMESGSINERIVNNLRESGYIQ